jgi:hypothetical protein
MIEFNDNKNPTSQQNWLEFDAREALTRLASSPPSPAGGRGLSNSKGNGVFGFSSFNFSPTRNNQNSLLPQAGEAPQARRCCRKGQEGLGMRVARVNAALLCLKVKNQFLEVIL